jgi:hypothetical protein
MLFFYLPTRFFNSAAVYINGGAVNINGAAVKINGAAVKKSSEAVKKLSLTFGKQREPMRFFSPQKIIPTTHIHNTSLALNLTKAQGHSSTQKKCRDHVGKCRGFRSLHGIEK